MTKGLAYEIEVAKAIEAELDTLKSLGESSGPSSENVPVYSFLLRQATHTARRAYNRC